mmetsp:Transcript_44406/g.117829  ORF Transcript_44406/g.117829 Transcript_44406/m.117829 type:complete len:227 (+) Transcript_44406:624-1304(+)
MVPLQFGAAGQAVLKIWDQVPSTHGTGQCHSSTKSSPFQEERPSNDSSSSSAPRHARSESIASASASGSNSARFLREWCCSSVSARRKATSRCASATARHLSAERRSASKSDNRFWALSWDDANASACRNAASRSASISTRRCWVSELLASTVAARLDMALSSASRTCCVMVAVVEAVVSLEASLGPHSADPDVQGENCTDAWYSSWTNSSSSIAAMCSKLLLCAS